MTVYALYLESGPRRRKTMVHVPDLLGCIARGETSEAALAITPNAIRIFLQYLQQHGEPVDPEATFTPQIAGHVMEGSWLGNGDPTPGFSFDFQPLEKKALLLYLTRLGWIQRSMSDSVANLSNDQLLVEPPGQGRSIFHILDHVAGSHKEYLRMQVGKVEGINEALAAIRPDRDALPAALDHLWQISRLRLEALTETECQQFVPHGQVTWTARRCLRRMLEHAWEHLLEINERLGTGIN
jgi:predicted RNase H-like HicB family nuclease